MANPAVISIPKDVWTKVATNVTAGVIRKNNSATSYAPTVYLQTTRITGQAAPTSIAEGAKMFVDSFSTETEVISSNSAIDVYVMALAIDGELRVDI